MLIRIEGLLRQKQNYSFIIRQPMEQYAELKVLVAALGTLVVGLVIFLPKIFIRLGFLL